MPYIKKDERWKYDHAIEELSENLEKLDENEVPGALNYIIFSLIKKYIQKKGKKYFRFNYLIGAIECCKKEIYRRLIGPYEDNAIKKNGDID